MPADATPYGFKLAMLVNEKTASASEIVSGAMQDHDRATILGEPSYGKGLVQSVFPLSEGTGLALTTALYYTPSGRSIQKPLDAAQFELGATTAHPNNSPSFTPTRAAWSPAAAASSRTSWSTRAAMNRLRMVLDASGSFTNFATQYLREHKMTADFEVTPQVLDEFQVFRLPSATSSPAWANGRRERDFITNRLKTEIFNQAFGVEKGTRWKRSGIR